MKSGSNFVFKLFFSGENVIFDGSGFGSVFEGFDDCGNLQNVSTQVVLDLFRNVRCPEGGDGMEFVSIDPEDIDQFDLGQEAGRDQINGEVLFYYCCLN